MFFCSKEEPVINNESLYQRKGSKTDLIFLDQSTGMSINRYSFVYKGSEQDRDIPIFFKALSSQLDLNAFIVLSWLMQIPEKSKVASKVIEKRYAKQGWEINTRDNHYLAIKELSLSNIDKWPPLGVKPMDGGVVMMLGDCDEDNILGSINYNDSLFLADERCFIPDIEFMHNLVKKNVLVLYQVDDDLGNIGFVLAGDVIVDMSLVSNKINISNIFEGKSAYKAFV